MTANINTNLASLNAQRNLNVSQSSLATSLQRLSSGLRINSAKDDAAGLAISERFTSQIRGNNQAVRNANDGISLAQTAEGGLSTAGDLLQRVRELAVQSANGSNSNSDRTSIQGEVSALTQELDRVANTTQFNGQNVLDGSLTSTQFQVGANANQTINVGVASAKASDIGNNTTSTSIGATAGSVSQAIGNTGGGTPIANNVTAQELSVTSGNGLKNYVEVAAGDSAKAIAANVNLKSAASGVSATASSVATINFDTNFANAGTTPVGSVQFTLRGANSVANDVNAQPVTISAAIKGNDLSAVAQAVNAQTGITNITASINQSNELVLTDKAGNDIQIGNTGVAISGTSGNQGLTGATIRGADTAPAVGATAAVKGAAITVADAGAASESVTVGGHVDFSSTSGFSITTLAPPGAGAPGSGAASGSTSVLSAASVGSSLQSVAKIDVSSVEGANAALLTIDSALTSINSNRAALGAIQNRFASTISNLQTTTENLSASRSRIQDTDFASETANLTRGQILQQAGTAILAQANSLPNGVLALLRG